MKVKYMALALMASMMVALAAVACTEEEEPIVFSDLNWTSAQVQNRIAQYIVEEGYGYPTDVVFGATLPLLNGLRNGDTQVTMEYGCPTSLKLGRRLSTTARWNS